MPLHALNPVLKNTVKSEGIESTASPNSELLAEVAEQDGPIDLSVKSSNELHISPTTVLRSKQIAGDGDSGFSPSSNEEVTNTAPLDLTSKQTPEPIIDDDDDDEQSEIEGDDKSGEE